MKEKTFEIVDIKPKNYSNKTIIAKVGDWDKLPKLKVKTLTPPQKSGGIPKKR